MNILLIIISSLTIISVAFLIWGIVKNDDIMISVSAGCLACLGIFGWGTIGCTTPVKTQYELIPKKSLEILVSRTKIIVTDLRTNKDNSFSDIETYNKVVQSHDSTFYVQKDFNMYGYNIKTELVSKIEK